MLITTLLELNLDEIVKLYDGRGGMEMQIKGDKQALGLVKQRQKRLYTQEAMILLAQLTHNLLVWSRNWFLAATKAAKVSTERSVKQALRTSGEVH